MTKCNLSKESNEILAPQAHLTHTQRSICVMR